ncbi:hypothetical protein GOBAR_DD22406 [Gossypium barbadense]|nr:hypothetical protein GOBAR_DD22406 [Gossypium barbadense]
MATIASGGASIGLINPCNSQQLIKHPSPFLGTKFKLKLSSKASPSIPKTPGVLSLKAQLIDAVRDLFVGVGVGLPCTVMECGDIIYRSTLPKPDGLTLTVPGVILAVGALSYLWATPGVAPGFFDMFVLAFLERLFRPTFKKTIMRQILFALDGLHSTGIVHRDIKPQNIIFSEGSRTFKIIDLGAAADLRVGINYIPKEFLLDPMNLPDRFDIYSAGLIFLQMGFNFLCFLRYAAPEQYIMSTQTPSAPSAPVATALSPVLWQAFPSLRTDSALIQFNRQLKRCDYDLVAWRNTVEPRASPDLRKGFELLDLDNGIGWELLTSMVRYKARQRISAKAALAYPYFDREGLLALSFVQNLKLQVFRATQQDYGETAKWIINLMAKSGTEKEGGFTEAQLQDLRDIEPKKKASPQRNALASALKLQRKIIRTLNESMDELSRRSKSLWWSRWIPKEE